VCVFDGTYYKITTTNYISKTSLYITFRMYSSRPWLLKILMFALLVTREIATYNMRLWRSRADFDVSWLNFDETLICGTWISKELVCSSFYWAFGCCQRDVKVAKTLPCYAMSAHIRSCMSSGIVWKNICCICCWYW
jgi:hypothetical protein